MRFKLFLFVTFILTISYSCDNTEETKEIEDLIVVLPEITGFKLVNEEGVHMGNYGGAVNNYLGNKDSELGEIKCYMPHPNPAGGFLGIYGVGHDTSSIKKVWLLQADFKGVLPDFLNQQELEGQPYTGEEKLIEIEITQNIFLINIQDIPNGYYRLYIESDNVLYYDNIIVNHSYWGR